jgi:hypothetical protein
MTAAAVGAEVGMYIDCPQEITAGDALMTTTGRTYVVVQARRQQRGKHIGRQHLRCVVADTKPPAGVRIFSLRWYRREPRPRR